MALILGIDRFMSECRALTNLVGNACACIVVARWENALDKERMNDVFSGRASSEFVEDAPLAPINIESDNSIKIPVK